MTDLRLTDQSTLFIRLLRKRLYGISSNRVSTTLFKERSDWDGGGDGTRKGTAITLRSVSSLVNTGAFQS